jgi:2'-5' RNA ligase
MNSNSPTYTGATSQWEDWQIEYQFGAFYVFPPDELRQKINRLRERFDPKSQFYCDAHISLTVPLPKALTSSDLKRFGHALAALKSFEVNYGPPTSYPGIPGVVLKIEPKSQFELLVEILESVDSFQGAKPRHHPFSPHMTIAEFITLERTAELINELTPLRLEGAFVCDTIAYAVPDSTFHFTERCLIRLTR